jgi:Sulfotransferase family
MVDLRVRRKEGIQPAAWRQKTVRNPPKIDPIHRFLGVVLISTAVLVVIVFPFNIQEPTVPVPKWSNERSLRGSATFLDFLVDLARLPTTDLRTKLYVDDVFQLAILDTDSDTCPFSSSPPWFPPARPRPLFTAAVDLHNTSSRRRLLWYEHLSKAGGTSFCKLAQINMKKDEVPPYYCMPRDGALPDGRVGLWSNTKLLKYRADHPSIRIVSNEWQPFPPERWELKDQLFFVTTLRDPLDRLMSAYHFWGILHNQEAVKPTFEEWLERKRKRSVDKTPQDMGNAIHIGRYNFAVWKFSNGTMPQGHFAATMPLGITKEEEHLWRAPFLMAAETLSNFDLVLILELISSHSSKVITKSIGWTELEKNHVVPSGKVENNHASGALPKDVYDALWEANRFDMILYLWIKAVHITKSRCS